MGAALAIVNGVYGDSLSGPNVGASCIHLPGSHYFDRQNDRMRASVVCQEASHGSGYYGGAADHNDCGRLLHHGVLSGGDPSAGTDLRKEKMNI